MRDGYRYFVSYPTNLDGTPAIEGNEPSFYRVEDNGRNVEFRSGSDWYSSIFPNAYMLWDDIFGSGATVREILDEKEIPRA